MLSLCEVGGHRQGLAHAAINAADLAVVARGALFSSDQNYLTRWSLRADASQPSVELLRQAKVYNLACEKCDPQLIVLVFSLQRRAKLVLGKLHTRTPHGETSIWASGSAWCRRRWNPWSAQPTN